MKRDDAIKLALGLMVSLSFLVGCDVFVPEKGDLGQACLGDSFSGWTCKNGLVCDTSSSSTICILSEDGGAEDGETEDGGLDDGNTEDGSEADGGDEPSDAGGDEADGDGDPVMAECGNRSVEPGEDCENTEPLGATCQSLGYSGGDLACDEFCQFDYSGCDDLYRRISLPVDCTGMVSLDWINGENDTSYLLTTCESGSVQIWAVDTTDSRTPIQIEREFSPNDLDEKIIGVCFGKNLEQLFSVFCQDTNHTSSRLAEWTWNGSTDEYEEEDKWDLPNQSVDLMRCASAGQGQHIVAMSNQTQAPPWVGVFREDGEPGPGIEPNLTDFENSKVTTLLLQAPAQDQSENVAELVVGLESQVAGGNGALRWSLSTVPDYVPIRDEYDSSTDVNGLALSEDSSHLLCVCQDDTPYLSIHDLVNPANSFHIDDWGPFLDMAFAPGEERDLWVLGTSAELTLLTDLTGSVKNQDWGDGHSSTHGRLKISAHGQWTISWADEIKDSEGRQVVTVWNDPRNHLSHTLYLDWISLSGDSFLMGDDSRSDMRPVHLVEVPGFEITRTEITAGQYQACVNSGNCTPSGTGTGCNSHEEPGASHPVNCVTWTQANEFCFALGARLPTEAEWEFAARSRGLQANLYPWGTESASCERAVMHEIFYPTSDCETSGTSPTCSKTSMGNTAQGLCDMAGNVSEWVQDCWQASYADAPTDGSAWELSNCDLRVYRGGDWAYGNEDNITTYYRHERDKDTPANFVGFRCARGGGT